MGGERPTTWFRPQKSGICNSSWRRFFAARGDSGLGCRRPGSPLVRFGLIAAVVVPFFASGWRLTDLESEIPLRAALLGFFLRTLEVERLVAAFRVFGQVDVNLKYFSY